MWILIFLSMMVAFIVAGIYLVTRVRKFAWVHRLAKDRKGLGTFISLIVCVLLIAVISIVLGYINAIIITIYLILFWIASDIIFWIVGRLKGNAGTGDNDYGKRINPKNIYYPGIVAILVTCIYMSWGWYQAHGVWQKNYHVETDKMSGSMRAVVIADSHVGTTFDGDGFLDHVKEIQAQNPDIVFIAGDYVDDDTSYEDMVKSCAALGTFDTKYGVYYVFGNHDKGYGLADHRGYDAEDLVAELEKNGVTVLQDQCVPLDNGAYVIGRQDKSEETDRGGKRADIGSLVKPLDVDGYKIVLDHQPVDYEAEKAAGADLVVSGHTHGGQLFLIKFFQSVVGVGGNNQVYGMEKIADSDFLVTSGISDWAIKFKTGCRSEYVIIDIQGRQ